LSAVLNHQLDILQHNKTHTMNRPEQLTRLKQTTEWDVIVIEAGLAWTGTALDAASRGIKQFY
jgi:endonuclease/exonuclease/phosphatase (EEP) superfamily protein YafD